MIESRGQKQEIPAFSPGDTVKATSASSKGTSNAYRCSKVWWLQDVAAATMLASRCGKSRTASALSASLHCIRLTLRASKLPGWVRFAGLSCIIFEVVLEKRLASRRSEPNRAFRAGTEAVWPEPDRWARRGGPRGAFWACGRGRCCRRSIAHDERRQRL